MLHIVDNFYGIRTEMDNDSIFDLRRRLEQKILDNYDEELEAELDDNRFDETTTDHCLPGAAQSGSDGNDCSGNFP